LASAWAKARQMRNLRTIGGTPSAKTRTLEFLKAIYPRCADNEQLEHVARSPEAANQALQDLAADGWTVVDCTTGEPPAVTGHRLSSLDKPS
jgi:hypothetical protein